MFESAAGICKGGQQECFFFKGSKSQVKDLCLSHPTPFYYNAINKILTAGTQRMPETFNEWQDLKLKVCSK